MIAAALLSIALAAAPAPADAKRSAPEDGAPACGLPSLPPGERPWRTGETLTYDLDVLGVVKTGTMQLSVERPMSGGKILPLRARAKTTSAVASLRSVVAVGLSWIDPATLLPERYRDEAVENGVRKVSDAKIVPGEREVAIAYQFGERTGTKVYPRRREVLDPLSALAYLRAARVSPGDRFCFDLVANRRFWRFEGTVASSIEKVDTPAGRFETLRIDGVARRADRPADRPRPVHLWLSTDARRLLVAAVSEIDLGPVRATLSGISGAR